MHLNKLRDIKRIKDQKFKFGQVGEEDDDSDEDSSTNSNQIQQNSNNTPAHLLKNADQ